MNEDGVVLLLTQHSLHSSVEDQSKLTFITKCCFNVLMNEDGAKRRLCEHRLCQVDTANNIAKIHTCPMAIQVISVFTRS